ncbi:MULTISPECIES: DUF885 domain-containing protein [unclassified Streptomyces]|uniref:DUF885 domain-containing protein n=1 Tax=unclassified Streptomyces TaxID=2593676 RepID=UPI001661188D|nr:MULTISPECIES: DUF885 domain-containing protein [unclassified Streptomyces]MBD0711497.1 hypothetical protein [Streptomyces sp. CBMA291]MBD0716032.1 hypothetical protein [Streptomyces sp. CBMA370]
MSALSDLADRYVDDMAALDPCLAAAMGVAGHEHRLTDFGPRATGERAELARRTLKAVEATPVTEDTERIAAAVLGERLATEVALADTDAYGTLLDTLDGPVQRIRQAVGLLDQGPDTAWETLLTRLRAVPATLAGLHESLETARRRGRVAPHRQVIRNARDCQDTRASFAALPAGHGHGPLRTALDQAATAADEALARFAAYLAEELAADAPEQDAVGEDRYRLGVREFLGTRLDLHDTYAWGWEELGRIQREMTATAALIAPGEPVPAVLAALDRDPRHRITGAEAFRDWLQELADTAIADLDGTHFTIPEALRRIDCRIAPGDGPAVYLAPSEDLSRPGTIWWSRPDPDAPAPTWTVPGTMFHEGVPGHHLQLGTTTLNTTTLNRFQRLSSELHPGHCEGWGLYAERLMEELGHFADPAHRLGMLATGQLLRAARVVLDIGLHLRLPIPAGTGFHEGEHWTPRLAHAFLTDHCGLGPPSFVAFEIDRYLGRPGQALAYKLGEKVWLESREAARRRDGAAFDLARFHHHALNLGPMGLDLLRTELTRADHAD